ncbi:MAG: DUF835 domain-containing protein [Methanomassiliicoccales archaeon]|nr:DUF835 domain-containing protein [Methanomassiliicoccales archaeon]
MPAEKSYAKGYLKGYEDGLREAWEELISLTMKGYSAREIQVLAKSSRNSIVARIRQKRKKFEEELGELDEEETRAPKELVVPTELVPGSVIILKGKEIDGAFISFKSLIEKGFKGLCVTRSHPATVKRKFTLNVPMVWLTKEEMPPPDQGAADEQLYVSPTDLPRLSTIVKTFTSGKSGNDQGSTKVILLEGVEYLITQNDFRNVLRFLQNVKDQVVLSKSILLIPIDPSTFEQKDLSLLELEMGR